MSQDPQLVEVLPAHRFDEHALAGYLREHLPAMGDTFVVRQFQGGQSNPTFLLETGGRRYVLRKKPPGKVLPSAHMVEREYKVIRALAENTRLPVPQTHVLCEDPSIIGTAFYVMDFIPGRILTHPALEAVELSERRPIHLAAVDTLAELHRVDPMAIGLDDFGRPQGYVARQVKRWSGQYEASRTDDMPAMDNLMNWLPENLPAHDETAIAHGDFRLGNLLFDPDAPRVSAILDWELATLGHPLADLAYFCLPYHLPADLKGMRGLIGIDLKAQGIPDEAEILARYCEKTGRKSVDDWHVFLAFSLFRLAAILQGVYSRALQGNASNADALEVGQRAGVLAEAGWRIAREGAGQ
ncbi:phosphotransferase [Hydrocarboniclastica marina]|uniref:Phosphotransferase family protein n=1 Tax=Hydrocarboniclastica marina TaxID=2259620 RepID=A0A4P7XEB4_9ALTE|nr:phosphotransferase [Hydrocarboniclastica marina]QCF24883.1 phosphotransferase family protein [Hydrocarboniclastica marina]